MKSTKKRLVSLILSFVVIVSSVGYVTSSSFNAEAISIKSPYELLSTIINSDEGENADEVKACAVSPEKSATAATAKKSNSFIDFWKNFANFFKNLFKFEKNPPTTTKPTTTTKKVTTTTTKKATTTTKKATTTKTTGATIVDTGGSKKTTTTTKQTTTKKPAGTLICDSAFLNEAAKEINAARKNAGLSELKADNNLTKVASVRVKEIKGYFSHTRPDGRKSYTAYADLGITKPTSVAENIANATRFENAKDIVDLWLSSPDHRALILSSKYTRFGMAWYVGDNGKEYAVMELGNG